MRFPIFASYLIEALRGHERLRKCLRNLEFGRMVPLRPMKKFASVHKVIPLVVGRGFVFTRNVVTIL